MTVNEFALTVIADPGYRKSVVERALAGTLPLEIEMFLLEMADERTPLSAIRVPAAQSPTLALIRSSAVSEEEA
jgi:hypothetical protein